MEEDQQLTKIDIERLVNSYVNNKRLNRKQRLDICEELYREIEENNIPDNQYVINTEKNKTDIIINLEYISVETLLSILDIAGYNPDLAN